MEYKLTETQGQYLKGLLTVELPIFVQGKNTNEIEYIAEVMYPLLTSKKEYLILEYLLERDGKMTERLHGYLEKPNNKIFFTKNDLPLEVETHVSDYILITAKASDSGNFSISSRIKQADSEAVKTLKLKPNHPRLQAPKYNGHEEYEYLVYDQRNKLRKTEVITVNSLSELEQAVEFTTGRRLIRKSNSILLGKDLDYFESVLVFEIMVDEINLPNDIIGDYLEKIRNKAEYADVYVVALVTV